MNGMVRGLVRRGLLTRDSNNQGAKVIPLRLSPQGRALLRSAHRAVSEVEERMLRSLDQDDLLALLDGLSRCVQALEGSFSLGY
jgi:DNA-binding MarR family transcriptional regulator